MARDSQRSLASASALASGVLFGTGLSISGMVNPEKVIAFLDVARGWDPSLALVMGGAIAVGAVAFRIARARDRTLLGRRLTLPTRRDIDAPLVLGAVGFGVGWGLAGLCPGPAVVALASGRVEIVGFVIAMLVGLSVGGVVDQRLAKRATIDAPQSTSSPPHASEDA